MWKRLLYSEINYPAWDACVHQDPLGLVYGLSWYLNAVAITWEGWVKEENGTYVAVVPLVIRRVAVFSVISQPLLTQQLGIFTQYPERRIAYWSEIASVIFRSHLGVEQYSFKPVDYEILKNLLPLKEQVNLLLLLNQEYAFIKANYSPNRLRDLKKAARANLQIQNSNTYWPQVFTLYRQNIFPRLPGNQQRILEHIIPRLVEAAIQNQIAQTWVVINPVGEILAGALFLQYKNRLIYLLPANSILSKKVGANTYLLDQVCQHYANSDLILDLEGSRIPGITHFFVSLGAQSEKYGLLENYNFSLPLKFLFALKNKVKLFRRAF